MITRIHHHRDQCIDAMLKALQDYLPFQAWVSDPEQVETSFTNLNSQLIADRDALRKVSFLRLALESTLPADKVVSLNAWRGQADYRVLYECQFHDSDVAGGLIACIQIEADRYGPLRPSVRRPLSPTA